ncbi:ABC transporter permease [Hymenobacter nivis]|uniref:FtsX-like permease family protein n=1 Tax=Hymenobacter nivis TaxID=1850093 RepID=A0A502GRN3_9BACT|nr:ABC transporter permease [Hymenobacter nivis]TPG64524.1 FtsX-like permease family protein [Hymenobacter nivis]
MLKHLFTLIWNRKRANALLIVEIFLAFVVLFVVGSLLVYRWQNYRAPLGFAYEQVWEVSLDPGVQPKAERYATQQQIIQRIKSLSGVRAVTRTASNTPFTNSHSQSDVGRPGEKGFRPTSNVYYLDDAAADVLQVPLEEGRWFDRRDDGAPVAVISHDLKELLFPHETAVGKLVEADGNRRVVGVAAAYRADGDFANPKPATFLRNGVQDTVFDHLRTLLVRVQPGAGGALEKQMSADIRAIGPGWSSNITPLSESRDKQMKTVLTPLVALVITCVFLIVNVALGLFGVLWQTINQRRSEIGLRRAIGASAGGISGQIVGEILVVATFGLALGLLAAAQFPLLGVLGVRVGVYLTAMALAAGLVYLLTVVCALYPSRLAAGIQPAVALREE